MADTSNTSAKEEPSGADAGASASASAGAPDTTASFSDFSSKIW